MDTRRDTDERTEGAVFAPTAIRARGRPPVVVLGLALALGGLALVGALDGLGAGDSSPTDMPAIAADAPRITSRPTRTVRSTLVPPPTGPASLVELDVRPAGSQLFIHGEVYSLNVIRVTVSIEDAAGHVSDVQSARLQGGSTAFRLGANARFDLRFDVPDEVMGEGLWFQASAYDFRRRTIDVQRAPVLHALLGAVGGSSSSGGGV
jgi:hypothetical protein